MSFAVTWAMKRYAQRSGMLDRPTDRSSHVGDTPRGGGVGIIVPMTIALLIMLGGGYYDTSTTIVTLLVVAALAGTGWLDDRYRLDVRVRMVVQLVTGVAVLIAIGSFDSVEWAGRKVSLGMLAPVITLLWFVWMANLYNFMDGIDGIAAVQGAISACTLGIWFTLHGDDVMALFSYVIMAASLGFLVWNWAPARVFMGDVGSVTLGGVFAVLALVAYRVHQVPVGALVLLFGVFLADATVTLLKRVLQGKVVWRAHREHFYQRAVIAGWSHAQVTTAVMITSTLMAVLATFEMLRVPPSALWVPLGVVLLAMLGAVVIKKDQTTDSVV